jgi:hypothetical protein
MGEKENRRTVACRVVRTTNSRRCRREKTQVAQREDRKIWGKKITPMRMAAIAWPLPPG